jgi:probable rRNA maturation factor
MDITLDVDEAFASYIDTDQIQQAIAATLQQFYSANAAQAGVAILITDNQTVQQLNGQYRNIDAPTDVLSFENSPDPDFPEVDPALAQHLGDIVIAYPTAKQQAQAAGHSPMAEVSLLTVHGLLHLLGFDHDTPTNRSTMWTAQQQVLTTLGLGTIQPTEHEQ